jgi:hypothetical protein
MDERERIAPTRRHLVLGGSLALLGIGAADALAAGDPTTTPDGYRPPANSRKLLSGIKFDRAKRTGQNYTTRFSRWDMHVGPTHDPSVCKGLYDIPNGAGKPILFWESKMAVDTDGAGKIPGDDQYHQDSTSLTFKGGAPVDALTVPYFVVPSRDMVAKTQRKFPAGPWEGSGDDFQTDMKVRTGHLGVVVFEGKATGALVADTGPAMKIGEASIRVHELVRGPNHPWSGPVPRKKLNANDGLDDKVLYFTFRDVLFDIDAFGPTRQEEMAQAIQARGLKAFQDFIAAQG